MLSFDNYQYGLRFSVSVFTDELKTPEPESEPENVPQVAQQPQMIQSFSPAVVASVATMVPQPQMPVMVRPFQLNPFGSMYC